MASASSGCLSTGSRQFPSALSSQRSTLILCWAIWSRSRNRTSFGLWKNPVSTSRMRQRNVGWSSNSPQAADHSGAFVGLPAARSSAGKSCSRVRVARKTPVSEPPAMSARVPVSRMR